MICCCSMAGTKACNTCLNNQTATQHIFTNIGSYQSLLDYLQPFKDGKSVVEKVVEWTCKE